MWKLWLISLLLVVASVFVINVKILLGILLYSVGFALGITALLLTVMPDEFKGDEINDKVNDL